MSLRCTIQVCQQISNTKTRVLCLYGGLVAVPLPLLLLAQVKQEEMWEEEVGVRGWAGVQQCKGLGLEAHMMRVRQIVMSWWHVLEK